MDENQKKNGINKALIVVIILLVLIIIGGSIAAIIIFNNMNNEESDSKTSKRNSIVNKVDKDEDENDEDEENEEEENNTVNNNTNNIQNNVSENNSVVNNVTEDENTNTTTDNNTVSTTNARISTAENPLGLNEWGLASKYVSEYLSETYANVDYTEVPVRITNVTRGENAITIIKNWINGQSYYKYQDPKENMEWVVVDYEVDLSVLTFDPGTIGTDKKINSSVCDLDGSGGVNYNGYSYIVATTDITGSDRVKTPGIYKGQFIVQLPIGCTGYLIKMGSSYYGVESYFKVE